MKRVWINGRAEWLPADWEVHIAIEGNGRARVTIERPVPAGEETKLRFLSLPAALVLRDCLVTSSRPGLRQPIT